MKNAAAITATGVSCRFKAFLLAGVSYSALGTTASVVMRSVTSSLTFGT